ncbi:MAG: hypothetical protein M3R04_02420 [bacterium]|nr:hypothetical protein [bacterium]
MTEPGRMSGDYDHQVPASLRMVVAIRVIEGRSTNGHRLKVSSALVVNGRGYSARVVSAQTGESLGRRKVTADNDNGGWLVEVLP